jgi:hypothetical protein
MSFALLADVMRDQLVLFFKDSHIVVDFFIQEEGKYSSLYSVFPIKYHFASFTAVGRTTKRNSNRYILKMLSCKAIILHEYHALKPHTE